MCRGWDVEGWRSLAESLREQTGHEGTVEAAFSSFATDSPYERIILEAVPCVSVILCKGQDLRDGKYRLHESRHTLSFFHMFSQVPCMSVDTY